MLMLNNKCSYNTKLDVQVMPCIKLNASANSHTNCLSGFKNCWAQWMVKKNIFFLKKLKKNNITYNISCRILKKSCYMKQILSCEL